jgi:hypothetical protein
MGPLQVALGGVSGGGGPGRREALLEFVQVGEFVRVAAVDPESGVEVVVMGPASAARGDLERLALRKLARALEAAGGAAADAPDPPRPTRPGKLV